MHPNSTPPRGRSNFWWIFFAWCPDTRRSSSKPTRPVVFKTETSATNFQFSVVFGARTCPRSVSTRTEPLRNFLFAGVRALDQDLGIHDGLLRFSYLLASERAVFFRVGLLDYFCLVSKRRQSRRLLCRRTLGFSNVYGARARPPRRSQSSTKKLLLHPRRALEFSGVFASEHRPACLNVPNFWDFLARRRNVPIFLGSERTGVRQLDPNFWREFLSEGGRVQSDGRIRPDVCLRNVFLAPERYSRTHTWIFTAPARSLRSRRISLALESCTGR